MTRLGLPLVLIAATGLPLAARPADPPDTGGLQRRSQSHAAKNSWR